MDCYAIWGKNALNVYNRLVEEVYGQLTRTGVFIDDVCGGHQDQQSIAQDLKEVLVRCKLAGLRLKLSKCFVGFKQVEFLGHVISEDEMQMMRSKLAKVLDMEPPKNRTEVADFLGLCGYYRRFMRHFSHKG